MKNNQLTMNTPADPPASCLAPLLWVAVAALLVVVSLDWHRPQAEPAPRQQGASVRTPPVAPYAANGEMSARRASGVLTQTSYLVADHVQAF